VTALCREFGTTYYFNVGCENGYTARRGGYGVNGHGVGGKRRRHDMSRRIAFQHHDRASGRGGGADKVAVERGIL